MENVSFIQLETEELVFLLRCSNFEKQWENIVSIN